MNRRRVALLCAVMTLVLLRWPVAGTDDTACFRTGEDRTGEQVTLTVNVVCSAKAGRGGDFPYSDKVAINLSETCVYRISSWSDTGVVLERISNTTNLSADGAGATSTPPLNWSYLARQPVTPVSDVSLDPESGTGQVYLANFLKSVKTQQKDKVQDGGIASALLEGAIMAAGSQGMFPGANTSSRSLGEQLRFKFKPDEKRLSGHGSCNISYKQPDGSYGDGTIEVNFNLILGSGSDVEAVITPVGDYKSWLPAAATKPGTEKPGNTITFKVELKDRKTHGPAKGQTAQFEFRLKDTSKEPGSCMNSPWNDADLDFRIRKEDNPQLLDIDADGQTAKSQERLTSSQIVIACFDGAACAGLVVIAQVRDGDNVTPVTAHLAADESVRVALPYDLDGNGIADAWEQQYKVVGKDSDTDEDDQPPGDRNNGDGLAIWEEYRGFLEGGKHIRTDPGTKDFFICDTIGGRVKPGIDRFAALTKLAVHGRLTLDELSLGRIINRNREEDEPHVVDQHGVMIDSNPGSGICRAVGGPGTPKAVSRVLIDTSIRDEVERVSGTGAKKMYPYFIEFVAHELLHCCNVWHHGQKDQIVWWQAGQNRGSSIPMLVLFEYVNEADAGHTDRGEFVAVWDDQTGEKYEARDAFWSTPRRMWVGHEGGEHSGNDDCVMRYDCSDAYAKDYWRYYVVNCREPVGQNLCLSPDGTGVNAPGHKPRPRYGDAGAGRGDCVERICVNDRYN